MKRSGPLQRKTPLKRSRFKRKAARPNPAGSDPAHLAWIREQPCVICGTHSNVEAHHSTAGRGLSQKTSDRETMPLCRTHHADFHNSRGVFAGLTKEHRRSWQRETVAVYASQGQTV